VQSADEFPAVPAGLVRETPQQIFDPPFFGDDPRIAVGTRFGDQAFEIDAEGLRGRTFIVTTAPISSALTTALAIAREAMQPYASGERLITLKCKRTAVVLGTTIGAPRLVSIPTLPDPSSLLYGETRLMRCVGVQEQGVSIALKFADLGLASVADPPTIGEPSTGSVPVEPGTVDADITRNAAGDPVESVGERHRPGRRRSARRLRRGMVQGDRRRGRRPVPLRPVLRREARLGARALGPRALRRIRRAARSSRATGPTRATAARSTTSSTSRCSTR
jgi:hypothetical protein